MRQRHNNRNKYIETIKNDIGTYIPFTYCMVSIGHWYVLGDDGSEIGIDFEMECGWGEFLLDGRGEILLDGLRLYVDVDIAFVDLVHFDNMLVNLICYELWMDKINLILFFIILYFPSSICLKVITSIKMDMLISINPQCTI